MLETKVLRGARQPAIAQGVAQTWDYMDRANAEEGHLILFDNRSRSWAEKIFSQVEQDTGLPFRCGACKTWTEVTTDDSHSPNLNRAPLITLWSAKDLLRPGFAFIAVKDDQVSFIRSATVQVAPGLLHALLDRCCYFAAPEFSFDHHALYIFVAKRPQQEQVGAVAT